MGLTGLILRMSIDDRTLEGLKSLGTVWSCIGGVWIGVPPHKLPTKACLLCEWDQTHLLAVINSLYAFVRTRLADMGCQVFWEASVGRRRMEEDKGEGMFDSITSHRRTM